jgi:hypothetical protein
VPAGFRRGRPGSEPDSGIPWGSLRREELLAALELVTDRRIDRYAQLTAIINGWPPFPSYTPAMEWLIAALRAHQWRARDTGSGT